MAGASRLTRFGNDLYTGAKSFDFVGRRWWWYGIAGVLLLIAILVPLIRGYVPLGIEFTGGSQFKVSAVADTSQRLAEDAVHGVVPDAAAHVTVVGTDTKSIQVQTELVTPEQSNAIQKALAQAYGVPVDQVSATYISGSWGQDISRQGIIALIVFVALAAIFMAIYFRTWKMSVAAIVSLIHDLVITVGVYAVFGFEITPSAVIGFLTILGYSLYDTVVVFDKVRENTKEDGEDSVRTFPESVNLAVNQTLVRSINTGVVAVLPVASILWIGAVALGAGTLRDIALALFIGIIVGTYSTIFIAAPLYSQMREGEPRIRKHTERVLALRAKAQREPAGTAVE
ncbi:MAG: protein-export membrane protein SecF [Micrococcales bacterium 73-13]|nr:MAG: protein-export membrane protein SecF [Micrococcales bacterium 73-13]